MMDRSTLILQLIEATKPPAKNLLQQQEKFDRFIEYYNDERPHQALNGGVPGQLYRPSARLYTGLGELEYPLHDRTITVTQCGRICKLNINLSRLILMTEAARICRRFTAFWGA
jgi:Integrase core domain